MEAQHTGTHGSTIRLDIRNISAATGLIGTIVNAVTKILILAQAAGVCRVTAQ